MQNKYFCSPIFFSFNLPTSTLFSVLKIYYLAQILCQNSILEASYQKRKGSGSVPQTNGSRSWRPKTCRSPTLPLRLLATGRPAAGEMVVGGEGGEGDSSGGHRGSTLLRPAASFCNIIRYQRKDDAKQKEKKKS
jgi:hypothetical protein